MVASRKTSCTGSPLRARAQSAVPICTSDVVKIDLVGIKINTDSWEQLAENRVKWRATVHEHIMGSEDRRHELAVEMRRMCSEHTAQQEGTTVTNTYQCSLCSRQCLSQIGLNCHKRRSNNTITTS